MNTYYNIKSPIDSNKGLRKIVEAYLNNDSKKSFYSRAVSYGEENNKFDEKEFAKFQDKINCMEFDRIRSLDEKKIKRESFIRKNYIVDAIYKLNNRRNSSYDNPSYEQYKLVQKYSNSELLRIYNSAKSSDMSGLSKEQIEVVRLFDEYILACHTFRGIAGYHVYAGELENYPVAMDELKYKIYLNLPYNQVYKFADKYMDACRANKIPYMFKVLAPINDNPNRAEKMCIYCDKDTFYKTIDIIRAIKSANPELKTKNPPIMAGTLDGWIGIGSDPQDASYNQSRAECIENALKGYFGRMSKSNAKIMLKNNPNALDEIRNAINAEADKMRINKTKFCFTEFGNEDIKEEGQYYSKSGLKLNNLRINGLGPKSNRYNEKPNKARYVERPKKQRINDAMFTEYANTRKKYGKNSNEVQDLINEFAKNLNEFDDRNIGWVKVERPPKRKSNNKKSRNNNYMYYPKFEKNR